MHLPDALDDLGDVSGYDIYRAMAAHQAAHIHYTVEALSAEQLSQAHLFFIGLVEDARVEWNAIQEFPGLRKLWGSLLQLEHHHTLEHATVEGTRESRHISQ